jgi:hypothetical protein
MDEGDDCCAQIIPFYTGLSLHNCICTLSLPVVYVNILRSHVPRADSDLVTHDFGKYLESSTIVFQKYTLSSILEFYLPHPFLRSRDNRNK